MPSNTIAYDDVDDQSILVTAKRVPEDERMKFLPRFFGPYLLTGEAMVYDWMHELAPDYDGGFWVFYELSNGGFYMAPEPDRETIRIRCAGNFYEGELSPDAAGIVATLHALNALAWTTRQACFIDRFQCLRHYAGDHAEGPAIFAAID